MQQLLIDYCSMHINTNSVNPSCVYTGCTHNALHLSKWGRDHSFTFASWFAYLPAGATSAATQTEPVQLLLRLLPTLYAR